MSVSSSPVTLSNDTSTPRSRDDLRASTIEEIVATVDIPALFGDGRSPVNVSEVERGLKDLMSDACRAVMGQYIEGLDDGRPTLLRDGEVWTRVPKTRNTIMTLFGTVTYERHRYRRAGNPSLVPVDEQLGLAMDYFTEPAGELAVLLYSQLPAHTCSDLCRRIGGMTLTESTLQRLARETVETWDEVSQEALEEIRDEEGTPQGAVGAMVSLDGVMVPMREERNGSLTTSYREASCGTLTWFDHEGEALRTVAMGRMPEANKRTLKAQLEDELAHLAKAAPHISAIAIADGAKDNWTFLETVSDHCLVDYWHACQHLAKAGDVISDKGKTWYARHKTILHNDFDGADKVIRSLRHYRRTAQSSEAAGTLREVQTYFENNRHRMNYRSWRMLGRPIGSGVVEAANKTLVTRRLKLSGQRWVHQGGQSVLTWRSLYQSGRFDAAWKHVMTRLKSTVGPPCQSANDNREETRRVA